MKRIRAGSVFDQNLSGNLALGIVIISLALIFEDALALIAGFLIGCIGIGLVIFIGEAVFQLI